MARPLVNCAIFYEPSVLEALRRSAQAAFDADLTPVLGLLLGRRAPEEISVTAWLPVGSGSGSREANLTRAMELARLEFPTEKVIGWFRSKHNGEARLTGEELDTPGFATPGAPPLTLVLRPSSQRPLRVAAYLPQAETGLISDRPLQEFFIQRPQDAVPATPASAAVVRPPNPRRFRASVERLLWAFPIGLLLLVGVAAFGTSRVSDDDPSLPLAVLAKHPEAAPAKAMPVPLRLTPGATQWQMRWNARPGVERASLTLIRDGQKQNITLTPSEYAEGLYFFPPPTGDLEILLQTYVKEQASTDATARVVASATLPPPASRDLAELAKAKQELQDERARHQRLMQLYGIRPAN
ncbi:MAG: hypothetical protein K2X03_01425 [Bryobacteraceae bacterium]|nr:hypothetical protein [Bryobacteraceae bacterium]